MAFPRPVRAFVLVLGVVSSFIAAGCDESSPTGPTVPLNSEFRLAPLETAEVDDTDARVQFVAVAGDSRCPADAICIQGGDARVQVRVSGEGPTRDYELHTGDGSRAEVTHRDLRIALVSLEPYPFSSRPIDPSDYRATLIIRR